MKTLVKQAFLSVSLVVLSCAASAVPVSSVRVEFNQAPLDQNSFYGEFSGVDADRSGTLTRNELSSFSASFPASANLVVNLVDLDSFSDFDITNLLWIPGSSGSWFAWGGQSDVNNQDVDMFVGAVDIREIDPDIGNAVPEPGSIALLGLGLAGLACVRRRKALVSRA